MILGCEEGEKMFGQQFLRLMLPEVDFLDLRPRFEFVIILSVCLLEQDEEG